LLVRDLDGVDGGAANGEHLAKFSSVLVNITLIGIGKLLPLGIRGGFIGELADVIGGTAWYVLDGQGVDLDQTHHRWDLLQFT